MSLEDEIRQLVLGMGGVATVYAADPVWATALKALGALLGPGGDAAAVPFVVCTEEPADRADAADPSHTDPAHTADPLAADDGGFPAGAAAAAVRPAMTVRVRIGTDGSQPAPALARAVAAAIRSMVLARRPELEVKVAVEVSAIGV